MDYVVSTLVFLLFVAYSKGTVSLTVPPLGKCGDDTVLTCHVTESIGDTVWRDLNRIIMVNGQYFRRSDPNKYTETRGPISFSLTIHKTNISDEGEYKCENGNNKSAYMRLETDCKASSTMTITNGKKVTVTVDKLRQALSSIHLTFKKENKTISIPGSIRCSDSKQFLGYYSCECTSRNSIEYGSYSYSLIVSTKNINPVTGNFRLVSPQTPTIKRGNESQSVTLECTSTGGLPAPTVEWYKENVSNSNRLAQTSIGIIHSDGTYTVTLQHTFLKPANGAKSFICRSYYPKADSGYTDSKQSSIMIYANSDESTDGNKESDITALIVGICLGTVCIVLAGFVVYRTVLNRRRATQNENTTVGRNNECTIENITIKAQVQFQE